MPSRVPTPPSVPAPGPDPLDQFFKALPDKLRSVVVLALNLAPGEGGGKNLTPRQRAERVRALLLETAPTAKEVKP